MGRRIVLNDDGESVEANWYVLPFNGIRNRWQARIELKWASGKAEVLWKQEFRHHADATAAASWRFGEWTSAYGGDKDRPDWSDLREKLATIEHERWSEWQRWMHDQCVRNADGSLTIPAGLVERWERQAYTHYDGLSEQEKDSDRRQVDRYLPLLEDHLKPS